jgi:uncharacterized membrane protein YjjB (DUF3815 family)
MMALTWIVIGAVLLSFGRRLFWLFVGAAGFGTGLLLATLLLHGLQEWAILLAALAGGVVGIFIALITQRMAVGAAGFVSGGYILVSLVNRWNWHLDRWDWVLFLVGGIVGAVPVLLLFDWALIVLSSPTGANLIVGAAHLSVQLSVILFCVLVLIGFAVQAAMLRRRKETPPPAAPHTTAA